MTNFHLLLRDQFREQVFTRDNYKCIVCGNPAKDAHHLIERRLWTDGGYYLDNGVSLCELHHIEAEQTVLGCDRLRELAGIKAFPIPIHFYKDQPIDKWGNPILPNGMRLKGELFEDQSVQKILAPVLHLFTNRIKYPRTFHLPWSPGVSKDDRILADLSKLQAANQIVVTVKQDGENTTLASDYAHARSIEYNPHPSRSWVKALHAKIAGDIPKGWRICGENLYAKHSIKYEHLIDFFQVFSIWDEHNWCLNWDETVEWCKLLGLTVIPTLYVGKWEETKLRNLYHPIFNQDPCEGYVVRVFERFHYREFKDCVGKFVRADHVQSHGHWSHRQIEANKLQEP